jgi:uncharacterized membrane protein YjgN (DUF898 family)
MNRCLVVAVVIVIIIINIIVNSSSMGHVPLNASYGFNFKIITDKQKTIFSNFYICVFGLALGLGLLVCSMRVIFKIVIYWLQAGLPNGGSSSPCKVKNFIFSTLRTCALGHTESSVQREAGNFPLETKRN